MQKINNPVLIKINIKDISKNPFFVTMRCCSQKIFFYIHHMLLQYFLFSHRLAQFLIKTLNFYRCF